MVKIINLEKTLKRRISKSIEVYEKDGSIVLEGIVDNWEKVVSAGKIASRFAEKGVVNLIECRGLQKDNPSKPDIKTTNLKIKKSMF